MITLNVEPYCHKCSNFEAKSYGPVQYITEHGDPILSTEIIITCAHCKICRNLYDILKGDEQ